MKKLFSFLSICFLLTSVYAQQTIYFNFKDLYPVKDYKVEKNTSGHLLLIALDSAGNTDQSIKGKYTFVINGFIEEPAFNNGEANIASKVDNTTFLYLKHESKTDTIYKLYFVIKGLVIYIPLWLIIIIPIALIILAFVIRKFLIMGIILLLFVLLFLGFGLSFSSLFNLLKESAAAIFS
jgi:hypothetical protein